MNLGHKFCLNFVVVVDVFNYYSIMEVDGWVMVQGGGQDVLQFSEIK